MIPLWGHDGGHIALAQHRSCSAGASGSGRALCSVLGETPRAGEDREEEAGPDS